MAKSEMWILVGTLIAITALVVIFSILGDVMGVNDWFTKSFMDFMMKVFGSAN